MEPNNQEWKEVELGEITECLDNKRIPIAEAEREKGDIPYYGANGQVGTIRDFIFNENLLLIAEDGGSWGANQRCSYIIEGKSWVNNHAHVLRVDKSKVEIFFIKYFLNLANLNKYISGTTRGKLNQKALNSIRVPFPFFNGKLDIQKQKQIVNILANLEKIKERRENTISLLDDYLKSIFNEMFLKNYFKERTLGDICKLSMGGTPSTKERTYWDKGKISWMKSGDIKGDFIRFVPNKITELGYKHSNATLFPCDTVVIALNGQGKTRGTTAILKVETTSNQSVAGIVSNKNQLTPEYLHFNLKLRYNELRNLTGDKERSGLNLGILRNLKISLPPIELQKEFASIVEKIEKLKEKQKQSLEMIEELFNSSLSKAFAGELI